MSDENKKPRPRSARRYDDKRPHRPGYLMKKELVALAPGYKQKFKLSLAEFKYVAYYIHFEGNQTEAAWAACPSIQNRKSASVRGTQMFRRPGIQQAIEYYRDEFLKDVREKCRHKAVAMLSAQAFYDPSDIINKDGRLVINDLVDEDGVPEVGDLKDLPPHLRLCIDGVERKKTGYYTITKVKLTDRYKALDRLNDFVGMFKKEQGDAPTVTEDTARALNAVFNEPKNVPKAAKNVTNTPESVKRNEAKVKPPDDYIDGQELLE